MFKQIDIRKYLYGIGIVILILMAILFLVWDNGSDFRKGEPYQTTVSDSLQEQVPQSPGMSGYLIKVILVTLLIIGILLAGAKWYGKLNKLAGSPSFIKILSKQSIGPKQYLLLIAIEQKKLLLGITENTINHIADLGEYKESDDVQYNSINNTTSFSSVLNYFRKDKNE